MTDDKKNVSGFFNGGLSGQYGINVNKLDKQIRKLTEFLLGLGKSRDYENQDGWDYRI